MEGLELAGKEGGGGEVINGLVGGLRVGGLRGCIARVRYVNWMGY